MHLVCKMPFKSQAERYGLTRDRWLLLYIPGKFAQQKVVTPVTSQGTALPAALFAAPSGNKGDALPDMIDSWDAKESSMIGVRVALMGRTLPDTGRAPADPGRGGLPADAGRDGLGLQPNED